MVCLSNQGFEVVFYDAIHTYTEQFLSQMDNLALHSNEVCFVHTIPNRDPASHFSFALSPSFFHIPEYFYKCNTKINKLIRYLHFNWCGPPGPGGDILEP